jgi:transposase
LRTGAPWRDIPPRYGTWQRLLKVMQAAADEAGLIDWDGAALDATQVKAHRSASGARKKMPAAEKRGRISDEWLGRSRGGITSKIHLCVDGHGLSLSIVVTAGQCSDAAQIGR